jgi:hypothetical protein
MRVRCATPILFASVLASSWASSFIFASGCRRRCRAQPDDAVHDLRGPELSEEHARGACRARRCGTRSRSRMAISSRTARETTVRIARPGPAAGPGRCLFAAVLPHLTSDRKLMMPADVHDARAEQVTTARDRVLDAAHTASSERFAGMPPRPPSPVDRVRIDGPDTDAEKGQPCRSSAKGLVSPTRKVPQPAELSAAGHRTHLPGAQQPRRVPVEQLCSLSGCSNRVGLWGNAWRTGLGANSTRGIGGAVAPSGRRCEWPGTLA